MGVPTDLKAEEALDQLHRLKFDSPRDPEAGVGLRELAAYYAPLDLWRALRRAGAETRDAVARSSNMPLAITTKIAQEIKGVAYAPDDSFTVRERLYLLKRVADLRSTIARDDFVRSLRKSPEVAAALGVPTDLKAEEALDQLHRLKYDAPRDPEAGVGLRELAAYYAPLDLWRCLLYTSPSPRDRG